MIMAQKNVGIAVPLPEKECTDKKCPFHGQLKLHGRRHIGEVLKAKTLRDALVAWERPYYLPKYERYEKRRTKLMVHNPPCIAAKQGDMVEIMESKKISKTKNFVIIQKLARKA